MSKISKRQIKRRMQQIDAHVGMKMRDFRIKLGMTQETLAAYVGVTFQQQQKNERGINRIAASRLMAIACVLGVQIEAFYQGLPKRLLKGLPGYVGVLAVRRKAANNNRRSKLAGHRQPHPRTVRNPRLRVRRVPTPNASPSARQA